MAKINYIVAIISIALVCITAQELYDSKYDNVDIEDILTNEKHRLEYYNCFMKTGPCVTDDEKFFGGIIHEVIRTNCAKCTEKQKGMLTYLSEWYTKNDPERWQTLLAKSMEN